MKSFLLLSLIIVTLNNVVRAQQIRPTNPSDIPFDSSTTLTSRVHPPTAAVLQMFRDDGMSPTQHSLSVDEQEKVATAFAALPPLHQRILQGRLRSISFLDNMPNTALTSTVNLNGTHKLFDITFRAEILNQDVSEWLTWKELTAFDTTRSHSRVIIQAGHLDAFQYVLLHEATHVVDGSLSITPDYRLATSQPLADSLVTNFIAGIWNEHAVVMSPYKSALLDGIVFRRGGKPLPIDKARPVYQALKQTPFVSLYGRSSWHEDLAEYVTVYHFTQKLGQPFTIMIQRGNQAVFSYKPMRSALVRKRFKYMARFY